MRHHNPRYLVDAELPAAVVASAQLPEVLSAADAVVVVTPSPALRSVLANLSPLLPDDTSVLLCTKGVEEGTGLVPCQIAEELIGNTSRIAALCGPNHAEEVVQGLPAATVIASASDVCAGLFQEAFACRTFRVYTSDDVLGVELCAAVKNVVAIACGISYGLGYGDNTAAMIITRGSAEMARLVRACGGRELTCMGLAGMGDLIATCMSCHSRNRRFGELLASGQTLDDFSAQTHMVAEGAFACRSVVQLARRCGVEVPISEAVRRVVWEGQAPEEAVDKLLERSAKPEFY